MKRSAPLARRSPLRAKPPARRAKPARLPAQTASMADGTRDWHDARHKIEAEGACRVCGRTDEDLRAAGRPPHERVEAAHTLGRSHDEPHPDGRTRTVEFTDGTTKVVPVLWVNPLDVVPLDTECHRDYDSHRLNLKPYLTADELARAEALVGAGQAERRLMGVFWRSLPLRDLTRPS